MKTIELLAPAKNLECGIAAISHGADAVYLGADSFGARASAGNPVEDIQKLCEYAHQYHAKVYVTVNTILYDSELIKVRELLRSLIKACVDAILIQDMAVVTIMNELRHEFSGYVRFPELHASTQTDNRNKAKVEWLSSIGFSRVVLARELSLNEIRVIHEAVPAVELEVFVHGALCVSYSGACYASQYCFHRSANRGECAQFCRLQFDLIDSSGRVIEHAKHLLSLKDLCQIDELEGLINAGASSFKIEGRLKNISYVKNVVSAYSQRLNAIIRANPGKYRRSSFGRVTYSFTPNLDKTFNRGFTHYFLHGRTPDIASFDTPKAMGECVGHVKEVNKSSFTVAGTTSFTNGDGLCFINSRYKLEGFRVNRAEGNVLFPLIMPKGLKKGMRIYRNFDQAFERLLSKPTAERRIGINMDLSLTVDGVKLFAEDETERHASVTLSFEHQKAKTEQESNMRKQLAKLGNTPFEAVQVKIEENVKGLFIPTGKLAELRREVIKHMLLDKEEIVTSASQDEHKDSKLQPSDMSDLNLGNVSNAVSRAFYDSRGMKNVPEAMETETHDNKKNNIAQYCIMTCRHCIRYSLGFCERSGGNKPTWKEPLFLALPDGKRFKLQFDCRNCQMKVYAQNS